MSSLVQGTIIESIQKRDHSELAQQKNKWTNDGNKDERQTKLLRIREKLIPCIWGEERERENKKKDGIVTRVICMCVRARASNFALKNDQGPVRGVFSFLVGRV